MDGSAIENAYGTLEDMGVDIFMCPLSSFTALAHPDGYLGVNPFLLRDGADELAMLIHEEGHFATGTFYQLDSPYAVREHQENVACRYGYKKYYSPARLRAAMRKGFCEPWQLAEYFGLPEAYVRGMLAYYAEACGEDFSRACKTARAAKAKP